MTISNSLLDVIEQARNAVQSDIDHHLNLGYRWAIYASFGAKSLAQSLPSPLGYVVSQTGHKRRIYIAILATEYVLPLWNLEEPTRYPKGSVSEVISEIAGDEWNLEEFQPHALLQTTKGILATNPEISKEVTGQQAKAFGFWDECIHLYHEPKYKDALDVAFTAVNTLGVAIRDELYEESEVDLMNRTECEWGTDCDVAFYAASAYAGGPIWVPESDSQKRLEFWTWWLTEAVPKAYQAFP